MAQVDKYFECFLWIMWIKLWMMYKMAFFQVIYQVFLVDNHVDNWERRSTIHSLDKQGNYGGK